MQSSVPPTVQIIVDAVLAAWPDHRRFLERRLALADGPDLETAEALAGQIARLCDGRWDKLVAGYRWMCEAVLAETEYFYRHGGYRLSTFAEARRTVYDRPEVMGPYVDGILLSQVLWSNHTRAQRLYMETFLACNPDGYRHVEIGPGHGLMVAQAAMDPRCGAAMGWDVSETSLAATRDSLRRLGVDDRVALRSMDVFNAESSGETFDSLVLSEVLEHLEQPRLALDRVRACLRPGGRAFLNVPVNSPAPDHIFLFRSPEEVVALVEAAGLAVDLAAFIPGTGFTEVQARRAQATISTVIIARRAD